MNCRQGFFLNKYGKCQDINECLTNNGECDPRTACTNTFGKRICGPCPSGYAGSGEAGCIAIKKCYEDNGGCDPLTTCTNTPNGSVCGSCPYGYAGDGESGCIKEIFCSEQCVLPETCGGGGTPGVCGMALHQCLSGDAICPPECNDWALDSDCGGIPVIHDFTFSDDPSVLLRNPWNDPTILSYQPLSDKAAEVTAGLISEYDKAYALASWIKGKAAYDMTSDCYETVKDLMELTAGKCEESATLLGYALRATGIPAGLTYQGNHATTFAYVDGRWVGFDATFGDGLPVVNDPATAGNIVDQASWPIPAYVFINALGEPGKVIKEAQMISSKTRRVPLSKEGGDPAGWGTVQIPVAHANLFILKDHTITTQYNSSEIDGSWYIAPKLRSREWFQTGYGAAYLPGEWKDYAIPTEYSVYFAQDRYTCASDTIRPNGYVQLSLPEGIYELHYDFYDFTSVAKAQFVIADGSKLRISPGDLEKPVNVDEAIFRLYVDTLVHAVEGIESIGP